MRMKVKVLGIAALAMVMGAGVHFITSKFDQDEAAVDLGPAPDADPEQARMERVATPQVSADLMQLPESQSVAIAPAPEQKSQPSVRH